jgi:hypothetical protein
LGGGETFVFLVCGGYRLGGGARKQKSWGLAVGELGDRLLFSGFVGIGR